MTLPQYGPASGNEYKPSLSQQIANTRDRLQGGPNRKKVRNRLQELRARQYFQNQNKPAPQPFNAQYESTVSGLQNSLNQSQADISGRELATQQQYGFTDQSNPFALARQLERNALQQRNRTLNSYAGAGQLYSGALSRARAQDQFSEAQSLDTLSREYQTALAGLSKERLDAQSAYDTGVTQAEAQRLEDTLNTPATPGAPPPKAVAQLLKQMRKRANRAERNDKDAKAKRIRNRLQDIQGR